MASVDSSVALVPQSSSNNSDVLPAFVDTIEELLNGLREVFPECEKVKKKLLKFRAFVKAADEVDAVSGATIRKGQFKADGAKILIKDWHSQLSPYYDVCRKRDILTLLASNLPIIKELDIAAKWEDPSFDPESRDNFFQYIDTLNMYAQMQFIPSKMLNRIEDVAQQLAMKMANGEANFEQIDVFELGKQVLDNTSEAELMEFAGNLGEIQKMVQMSSAHLSATAPPELAGMAEMMSNMASQGGGGEVPGMPGMDMGLVMKMMGGALKNLK